MLSVSVSVCLSVSCIFVPRLKRNVHIHIYFRNYLFVKLGLTCEWILKPYNGTAVLSLWYILSTMSFSHCILLTLLCLTCCFVVDIFGVILAVL